MAFWVYYDHFGKLVLANLILAGLLLALGMAGLAGLWTGVAAFVVLITVPAAAVSFGVVVPVFSAGLAHVVKELVETGDGSFVALFRGIGLYWRRAMCIGFIYMAAVAVLLTSAWFYAVRLGSAAPWLGYGIA
ncbi:MAG: hypothetical protein NTZ09_09570, partial [Candidatus Hydrogenedentes bacterium]|nr:hypothetical protein [Candidatus Hydrogenedentota bacterium]